MNRYKEKYSMKIMSSKAFGGIAIGFMASMYIVAFIMDFRWDLVQNWFARKFNEPNKNQFFKKLKPKVKPKESKRNSDVSIKSRRKTTLEICESPNLFSTGHSSMATLRKVSVESNSNVKLVKLSKKTSIKNYFVEKYRKIRNRKNKVDTGLQILHARNPKILNKTVNFSWIPIEVTEQLFLPYRIPKRLFFPSPVNDLNFIHINHLEPVDNLTNTPIMRRPSIAFDRNEETTSFNYLTLPHSKSTKRNSQLFAIKTIEPIIEDYTGQD